jgi:hypothetical protein
MSHFARINKDNVVTQVIVAEQDFIDLIEGEWIQTSYNTYGGKHLLGGTPLRMNYAGIGYIYNREYDAFYPPQPFNSWRLRKDTFTWDPPVEYPTDGKEYIWDEESLNWKELVINVI